jgi:sarcosine oxidase / L-pipecolate oxidase
MEQLAKDTPILIIGGGTFGLSTAYHLALDGYSAVTVLEAGSTIPSPLSAANDINKIVRAEYIDPFYTDLALEAIEEWKRNPTFSPHFRQTGYLLGNSGAAPTETKRTVARQLESLQKKSAWTGQITPIRSRASIRAVAPAFDGPMDGWSGYFNKFAGYAHAANALRAIYEAVIGKGVTVHASEAVVRLDFDGNRCVGATTATGRHFIAQVVVLTLGASLGRILPSVGRQVVGKAWSVAHIQLQPDEAEKLKDLPVTFARDLGFFFEPEPGTGLFKLSASGAGLTNFESKDISVPPMSNDFIPVEDEAQMRQLLKDTLPALADRPLIDRHICWCADTADSNYIIDAVPGKKCLYVATGDSGHGFKMLPIAGKWIKELIEKGCQDLPRWRWKDGTDASTLISGRWGNTRDLKVSSKL